MDSHRVDVLHVADGERRVVSVPDDLVFDLLVALDALFDEHLPGGRKAQGVFRERAELRVVFREAPARAAEGKGGAHDNRIACRVREGESTLKRRRNDRGDDRLPDRFHGAFKNLTVFGFGNGFRVCTKKCYALLCQKSFLCQLHRKRQAGLTAEGGKNAVGVFFFDDFF